METRPAFTGDKNVDKLILLNVPDRDLAKVCRTNKYVASLCRDNNFWMNRVEKTFGPILGSLEFIRENYLGDNTWKQYYLWT